MGARPSVCQGSLVALVRRVLVENGKLTPEALSFFCKSFANRCAGKGGGAGGKGELWGEGGALESDSGGLLRERRRMRISKD